MAPFVLTVLAALSFSTATANAQVVQWGIRSADQGTTLTRRATVNATAVNSKAQGGYIVVAKVGTPGQSLEFALDTGSSDVWVPENSSMACTTKSGCTGGSFKPSNSETYVNNGTGNFNVSYGDESGAVGDYFKDTFQIGNVSVKNLTMGLGKQTDIPLGLMGIAYNFTEGSVDTESTDYPNLPVVMQQQGLINSVAYSLWLNGNGSILFGGIDTDKYTGDLMSYSVVVPGFFLALNLTSIEATSPSGTDALTVKKQYPLLAFMDSGTTVSYIPEEAAKKAWKEVGAEWQPKLNLSALPCSYANNPGHFAFGFDEPSNPKINITMSKLVVDVNDNPKDPLKFESGKHKGELLCAFGLQKQDKESPTILGDSFLQSVYIVYDIINGKIAMAPINPNSTKSNIVPFASIGAQIPSATAAMNLTSDHPPKPKNTGMSAQKGFNGTSGGDDGSDASHLLGASAWGLIAVLVSTMALL